MSVNQKCGIWLNGEQCEERPVWRLGRPDPQGYAWLESCALHVAAGLEALGAHVGDLDTDPDYFQPMRVTLPPAHGVRPVTIEVTRIQSEELN